MSKKIVLDAGHYLHTPGKRTCNGSSGVVGEWVLNNAICNYITEYLKDYDVQVIRVDDPTGRTDTSLQTRVNRTNAANPSLFVSIHHNALSGRWGNWTGIEVFSHSSGTAADRKLASILAPKIASYTGLKNRGAKTSSLWVLTCKSHIPAVLCEGGFMDSTIDYPVITSTAGKQKYAKAVADGIVEYLGLTKKVVPKPKPTITYPFAEGSVIYPTVDIKARSNAGYKTYSTSIIEKGTRCVVAKYHNTNGLFMALTDENGKYFQCTWTNEFCLFTTVQPIVEEPVVEKPIVEKPIVEEPIKEEPIKEELVKEELIIEEPAIDIEIEIPEIKENTVKEKTLLSLIKKIIELIKKIFIK